MALWTVAFLGSTPIGGPIDGYVAQHAGAPWALALGGASALLATGIGAVAMVRARHRARSTRPSSQTGPSDS